MVKWKKTCYISLLIKASNDKTLWQLKLVFSTPRYHNITLNWYSEFLLPNVNALRKKVPCVNSFLFWGERYLWTVCAFWAALSSTQIIRYTIRRTVNPSCVFLTIGNLTSLTVVSTSFWHYVDTMLSVSIAKFCAHELIKAWRKSYSLCKNNKPLLMPSTPCRSFIVCGRNTKPK